MERTNLTYGAMARLCRDGGFWVCPIPMLIDNESD